MNKTDISELCSNIAKECKRRLPEPNDVYKHFKGNVVFIKDIAVDTESLQPVVVYTHNGCVWSRPLKMFLSEVDKNKYPEVKAKYRFERLIPENKSTFKMYTDILNNNDANETNYNPKNTKEYILDHYYK